MAGKKYVFIVALSLLLIAPMAAELTSLAIGQAKVIIPPEGISVSEIEGIVTAGGRSVIEGIPAENVSNASISGEADQILGAINVSMPKEFSVEIPSKAKKVYPGDVVHINVKLVFPESFHKAKIKVVYNIIDTNANALYSEHETKEVASDVSFTKAIVLPEQATPGYYILSVSIYYGNHLLRSEWDTFEIKEKLMYRIIAPKLQRKEWVILAVVDIVAILLIGRVILRKKGKQKPGLLKLARSLKPRL